MRNSVRNRMSQWVDVHIECVRVYMHVCALLLACIYMTTQVSFKLFVCSYDGGTVGVWCYVKWLMKPGKSLEFHLLRPV